ncbi:MAG: ABC transporter ATP-binding protein [Chloroflexi bacterium]|nr:ABC transporter ATP-binding protein [Chloroflexota bacterium]
MAVVETRELTKRFGDKLAVDRLTLTVEAGEFFGFLGPNGAGKSTTIKMMVGLLRPTSGAVRIDGVDVWHDPVLAKSRIGVLPEHLNLYERLNGREYLTFAGHMYGVADADVVGRAGELLDLLDLGADAETLIVDYSQGMRKKVALGAALIHRPRVLFLDEPFEGIDAVSSRAIRDVLRALAASGTTIFFSSHILDVVERLCTRVGIIDGGRLVAEGTLDELRRGTGAAEGTLEEVFLSVVGADSGGRSLSWLE